MCSMAAAMAPIMRREPTSPLGVYGRSKLAGEEQVACRQPASRHLRTAWVYSPFGTNFVKTMMNAAHTRDVLTVVDDQVGGPTSALDLAEGLFRMASQWTDDPDRGLGAVYNLTGSGSTSWCGFASFIMAECRTHSLPSPRSVRLLRATGRRKPRGQRTRSSIRVNSPESSVSKCRTGSSPCRQSSNVSRRSRQHEPARHCAIRSVRP